MTTPDAAAPRLPIKLDATTNGEFAPVPLDAAARHARRLARAALSVDSRARRRACRAAASSGTGANSPFDVESSLIGSRGAAGSGVVMAKSAAPLDRAASSA